MGCHERALMFLSAAFALTLACNAPPRDGGPAVFAPGSNAPAQPRNAGLVRASGVGYPPKHGQGAQARLMARRAAEVVAVRNLGRKLGAAPRGTVRRFRYVSATYRPDGSVKVVVESRR